LSAGAAVFRSLEGDWALDRVIEPGIGSLEGTARFSRLGETLLLYREEGKLLLTSGYSGEAFREYHYLLEGDQIRICFVQNGKTAGTMYTLRLDPDPADPDRADPDPAETDPAETDPSSSEPDPSPEATDVHLCNADIYRGQYRFDAEDRFTVRIEVTGPAKDHQITSRYQKKSG